MKTVEEVTTILNITRAALYHRLKYQIDIGEEHYEDLESKRGIRPQRVFTDEQVEMLVNYVPSKGGRGHKRSNK